ncbi:MAG: N-(5'-phosphoribosyl)anthranilate isomerase [Actinomycetia bacterium]|nr:N-(5'-phosphoribosyl)anthranilate isomerase [Actinomycetes bacterium]
MRPVVKLCGQTDAGDAAMCARYGADVLGFVVYPEPVPWNLEPAQAARLVAATRDVAKTCLVTAGDVDAICRLARATRPDYVQLHGRESVDETAAIVDALAGTGIGVIKAVFPDAADPEGDARAFCHAGVAALVADTRMPGDAATGGAADVGLYRRLVAASDRPVFLAGGVAPGNAAGLVQATGARYLDVLSGVEREPRRKDEGLVATLFATLAGAE